MYLKSSIATFSKKIFTKSAYLLGILVGASSTFKLAIGAFFEGCTLSSQSIISAAIYTIKILYSKSRAAITNFFFSISSTYLVVGSTSLLV